MYSRKSVEPRMDPWGTPTLTLTPALDFTEDFPSRTSWSPVLLRKKEIRPNIWPEIHKTYGCKEDQHVKLCQKPWKDLLKALAILSDSTVRRSAVDWEDLKPVLKIMAGQRWLTVVKASVTAEKLFQTVTMTTIT